MLLFVCLIFFVICNKCDNFFGFVILGIYIVFLVGIGVGKYLAWVLLVAMEWDWHCLWILRALNFIFLCIHHFL